MHIQRTHFVCTKVNFNSAPFRFPILNKLSSNIKKTSVFVNNNLKRRYT